jgi:glycosyltransferase involved in cell wall biosynthesis
MANDTAVCTVVSKNHLALARAFAGSFRRHHPGVPIFVLLADRVNDYFSLSREPFEVVPLEAVGIPNTRRFCFQYTIFELNCAAKPYLIRHLLKRPGISKLLYLDADVSVYRELDELYALLDRHSILLTPHFAGDVPDDGRNPSFRHILASGVYNAGFVGVRKDATGERFLDWWCRRVYTECIADPSLGLFVDQKWLDVVPGLFDGVHVVRQPGYNVGHWSLSYRTIGLDGDAVLVDGQPLCFFHFSGLDLDDLDRLSRHQNRFTLDEVPALRPLFERYRERVLAAGYRETSGWPYAFSEFDNGVRIPRAVQRLYWSLGDRVDHFGDPFATEHPGSFWRWLYEETHLGSGVPRFWYQVYLERPDLQRIMPEVFGSDRRNFMHWVRAHGHAEYGVPPAEGAVRPDTATAARGGHDLGAAPATRAMDQVGGCIRAILRPSSHAPGVVPAGEFNMVLRGWANYLRYSTRSLAYRRVVNRSYERVRHFLRRRRDEVPLLGGWARPTPGGCGATDDLPAGVNLAGHARSEKGVGEALRSTVRALTAIEFPHCVVDWPDAGSANVSQAPVGVVEHNPYPVNLIQVNADALPYFVQSRGPDFLRGKYNIGFWMWELSEFPPAFHGAFMYLDEVWVASNYCLDAVSRVSPIPVVKIPLALSAEGLKSGEFSREHFGLPPEAVVFLFIFDAHSVVERKNPSGLIRAFKRAFKGGEDVRLVLKLSRGSRAVHEALYAQAQDPRVLVIDRVMERSEINSLIEVSDCYVSLHRSEGFGMTIAEAMALGKPTIATAYSANVDFMTLDNSFLVRYDLVRLERDFPPYPRGSLWADPDVEHAAELMRAVYESPDRAAEVGRRAARDIWQNLAPQAVGDRIRDRLAVIGRRLAAKSPRSASTSRW